MESTLLSVLSQTLYMCEFSDPPSVFILKELNAAVGAVWLRDYYNTGITIIEKSKNGIIAELYIQS